MSVIQAVCGPNISGPVWRASICLYISKLKAVVVLIHGLCSPYFRLLKKCITLHTHFHQCFIFFISRLCMNFLCVQEKTTPSCMVVVQHSEMNNVTFLASQEIHQSSEQNIVCTCSCTIPVSCTYKAQRSSVTSPRSKISKCISKSKETKQDKRRRHIINHITILCFTNQDHTYNPKQEHQQTR